MLTKMFVFESTNGCKVALPMHRLLGITAKKTRSNARSKTLIRFAHGDDPEDGTGLYETFETVDSLALKFNRLFLD